MDKETRNAIDSATQRARRLLEADFTAQLDGDFDIQRTGAIAATAGSHLSARQAFQRDKIVAAIEHKRAAGMSAAEAVADYLRDAAFTSLNRFVALKMLEARDLVQECVTKGEQSAGYREFCGMAPGLPLLPDSAGYRLYIESLFDELSTEVKVLFDRRDVPSVLWPRRATFEQLLGILNEVELAGVWGEDETIGWVYQYFNGADERRKMREESQVPRNSRELAVRNQFFTPRYVVQFLTDNTLGRIWYEMRNTKTALAEHCKYMVRKAGEEFAPRAKKDPRDLRVLDPACGSGHFLLYAFDLLLTMYEEAHADAISPKSETTGHTLIEDYPNLDALRRSVPALILAHNLHGVDIDARCAQIAQLALWMRAQRSYRDSGVARADRPPIRRSNLIIAEPLVADERLAEDFVARLDDVDLGRIFTGLVHTLKLAGDLGLLLRVEGLVGEQPKRNRTGDLFAPPEDRIRAAIARFTDEEIGRTTTRKKLFADDAAQGIGLLSLAETRFDAVLMNPPFGAGSARAKQDFDKTYPRTKTDVYAAFIERGIELLCSDGRLGAITSRTGFFLSSFQAWREEVLLRRNRVELVADLGLGVMDDAMVEAAAYCIAKNTPTADTTAIFIRALDAPDKAAFLSSRCKSTSDNSSLYCITLEDLSIVPGSPFAYWVTPKLRSLFRDLTPLEHGQRMARAGGQTSNDPRYLRAWWETPEDSTLRWCTYLKGGSGRSFYYDQILVAPWDERRNTFPGFLGRPGRASERPSNSELYFRPGITWPLRSADYSPQVMPAGAIFTVRSYAVLDSDNNLLALLGLLSSSIVDFLFKLLLGRFGYPEFVVGALQKIPIPKLDDNTAHQLERHAASSWRLLRRLDTTVETSHAFILPLILSKKMLQIDLSCIDREIATIQQRIDLLAFTAYEITTADRSVIEANYSTNSELAPSPLEPSNQETDEISGEDVDDIPISTAAEDELASWLVGVAFGRYDMRLATGARLANIEPEPFDPLPRRSPGMVPDGESGLLLREIFVDDEGHQHDLFAHVAGAASKASCAINDDLRRWLTNEFFALHITMYSKGSRKAPIYWQLATTSASYSVWLYIHAFTTDTLFRVQNDYIGGNDGKLAHEERRLEAMSDELRDKSTAADRKVLAAQEAFVDELRAFLDEVKRVAPLWKPNLDDGVIINFAPLWRLVPQHKAWQKELKATWDELCKGKYDWAHLAMHLWPERVVPTCATDRSFAIAHGLEEVFWVEGSDGKWSARKEPTRPIEDLVAERTSPAVKAALQSLLEAPVAAGGTKKVRKGKKHA